MIYHVISRYITLYHVISRYITLYRVISRYITLYHVISRYITLYRCYITLYHVISTINHRIQPLRQPSLLLVGCSMAGIPRTLHQGAKVQEAVWSSSNLVYATRVEPRVARKIEGFGGILIEMSFCHHLKSIPSELNGPLRYLGWNGMLSTLSYHYLLEVCHTQDASPSWYGH